MAKRSYGLVIFFIAVFVLRLEAYPYGIGDDLDNYDSGGMWGQGSEFDQILRILGLLFDFLIFPSAFVRDLG